MNTAAASLLHTLENFGIQTIRFRVTSAGENLRHTIPVAQSMVHDEEKRFNDLSVPGLFGAYSLTPRRGEYLLDVIGGTLSYTPPAATETKAPARLALMKKRRTKSKHHHSHHKLAA